MVPENHPNCGNLVIFTTDEERWKQRKKEYNKTSHIYKSNSKFLLDLKKKKEKKSHKKHKPRVAITRPIKLCEIMK